MDISDEEDANIRNTVVVETSNIWVLGFKDTVTAFQSSPANRWLKDPYHVAYE